MQKKLKQLTDLEFKLFQSFCKIDNDISQPVPQKILINILVSGGRDSMCLLHAINAVLHSKIFKPQSNFVPIVTHFNHKKRGQESDAEAFFVQKACLHLGIECFHFEICQNNTKSNFQNFARQERRRLSLKLCERLKNSGYFDNFFILTGHHAQDHVESVLMHLIRGSGIAGLQGFYNDPILNFLKPLSEISVEEIQNYSETKGIEFLTDSSNLTDNYDRNFLRHQILPQFKRLNGKFDKNILRCSKQLKELSDIFQVSPSIARDEFVFLPSTTKIEFYFYLKSVLFKENSEDLTQNMDISENILENIFHEVELLRLSSTHRFKLIPLKHSKKLSLYKNHKDQNKIFAHLYPSEMQL